jgi:hypothetical protein
MTATRFTLVGEALVPLLAFLNASQAAETVTTIPVPNGGQAVTAKCDSAGTIHLVYDSADGPQYVQSKDEGNSFSRPIAVVGRASRQPGLVFTAWDLAIGEGNRVHIAMGTNAWKLKLPQEGNR